MSSHPDADKASYKPNWNSTYHKSLAGSVGLQSNQCWDPDCHGQGCPYTRSTCPHESTVKTMRQQYAALGVKFNKLDDIAALVRTLTYKEMMEWGAAFDKLVTTDSTFPADLKAENFAAMFSQWAENRNMQPPEPEREPSQWTKEELETMKSQNREPIVRNP